MSLDEQVFDSLSTGAVDNAPPRNPYESRVEQGLTRLSREVFHRCRPPHH